MGSFAEQIKRDFLKDYLKLTDLSVISKSELDRLGARFVQQMKAMIAGGKSPITGRAFPKYKNPARYPGRRKPSTPVNLRLSGAFLTDLTGKAFAKRREGVGILVSYRTALSNKKEEGHRDGVNKQPKRPTIPEGNEEFAAPLLRFFFREMSAIIKRLT